MNPSRLLELAISGLQAQKNLIDEELALLLSQAGETVEAIAAPAARATKEAKTTGRKPRTAAQKKAHSERMRKIWAERKKAQK